MTAEEDIEILKRAADDVTRKRAEKEKRSDLRERSKHQRKLDQEVSLHQARHILWASRNRSHVAAKKLTCAHYRALLSAKGQANVAKGLKKDSLVRLYWARHRDVTADPGPLPQRLCAPVPTPVEPPVAVASHVEPERESAGIWGDARARKDAMCVSESESDDSEIGEGWDHSDDESNDGNDGESVVRGMVDEEWEEIGVCEVEEEDNTWKECRIMGRKSAENPGDRVCLWFGRDEYEGLPDGSYTLNKETGEIFDGDNDEVMSRNFVFSDGI